MKAGVELVGTLGDPCECKCGGVNVSPKNPNSWKYATSLPCVGCEVERVRQPGCGDQHAPYCEDCSRRFLGTRLLERKDNPFAQALTQALKRKGITLQEA